MRGTVVLEDALEHGIGGRFTAIRKGVRGGIHGKRSLAAACAAAEPARWPRPARGCPPVTKARGRRRHVRGMALGCTAWHTAHGQRLACEEGPQQSRTVLGRWPSGLPAYTPGAHGAFRTDHRCMPRVTPGAAHFAGAAVGHRLRRANSGCSRRHFDRDGWRAQALVGIGSKTYVAV